MPPQRILPQPPRALILLHLQPILVPNLPCADAQVAHTRHEIEPDLRLGVARDAALKHRDDFRGELGGRARAVQDGRGLQAVELVELVGDGRVGDEVVDVVVVGGGARGFVDEGRGAREGVVGFADEVRVGEGLAT
jgi:hypothetical protein